MTDQNDICACLDKDEYTCYYLRYVETYHNKYPASDDDPEIDDVLPSDITYCWCWCHSGEYGEGWLKKNDITKRDIL